MKEGGYVNQALINELYATHKGFPDKDLTYGLFTINKNRKFNLVTFKEYGKTTNFKLLKKLLQRNKQPNMGIFWWKEYGSSTEPPFIIRSYPSDVSIESKTYFLLGGRISLDNSKKTRAIHENVNFPIVYSSEANYAREMKEVFLNDFVMKQEDVFKNLNVEGDLEFMIIELENETKEAKKMWIGSNFVDLKLSKSRKFFRVAYDYNTMAERVKLRSGGLNRAVISLDYDTDYFDFTDLRLPEYTTHLLSREERNKIKPCSLSFINYPVENDEGFDEYCAMADEKTRTRFESNTIIVEPRQLGFPNRTEEATKEVSDADIIKPEDTIIQVFHVVKTI